MNKESEIVVRRHLIRMLIKNQYVREDGGIMIIVPSDEAAFCVADIVSQSMPRFSFVVPQKDLKGDLIGPDERVVGFLDGALRMDGSDKTVCVTSIDPNIVPPSYMCDEDIEDWIDWVSDPLIYREMSDIIFDLRDRINRSKAKNLPLLGKDLALDKKKDKQEDEIKSIEMMREFMGINYE